jgi:two-component system catabolic regulation response regulator CreB
MRAANETAILVVEDEPAIADNIVYALGTEGFIVHRCALGAQGVQFMRERSIDLVILDVGLPDGSGLERCKEIRSFSSVPIIFLSARGDEIDRVVGLEIGADDYVTKPFSPRELVARCKTILKRARATVATPPSSQRFVIDESKRQISYRGAPLELTRYEYLLLEFLMSNPDRVYSRTQLQDQVWESSLNSLDRTVDAHIKTLRAKLRAIAPDEDPIRTHRGFGYSLSSTP